MRFVQVPKPLFETPEARCMHNSELSWVVEGNMVNRPRIIYNSPQGLGHPFTNSSAGTVSAFKLRGRN